MLSAVDTTSRWAADPVGGRLRDSPTPLPYPLWGFGVVLSSDNPPCGGRLRGGPSDTLQYRLSWLRAGHSTARCHRCKPKTHRLRTMKLDGRSNNACCSPKGGALRPPVLVLVVPNSFQAFHVTVTLKPKLKVTVFKANQISFFKRL